MVGIAGVVGDDVFRIVGKRQTWAGGSWQFEKRCEEMTADLDHRGELMETTSDLIEGEMSEQRMR